VIQTPKVILYIAVSLDGYIAGENDDLSFLDIVGKQGEDYGYNNFLKTVDTIITGRRTFDWVVNSIGEFPNKNIQYYVISKSVHPEIENVKFYSGNIENLVLELKNKAGKNIFLEGGSQIVSLFLKYKLIDEFIISVIPIIIGKGINLYTQNYSQIQLELISSKSFESGLVQVHYKVK